MLQLKIIQVFIFTIAILINLNGVIGDEHSNTYYSDEEIVLWMNNVGPYNNHQETYTYFSLPFCKGDKKNIEHYHESLSEALLGVELEFSGLDMKFRRNLPKTIFCEKKLSENDFLTFLYAVEHNYWYQMYLDDLPMWNPVGELVIDSIGSKDHYLYTHKKFEIGFNGNRIVDVNVTQSGKVLLKPHMNIQFSYEVYWLNSDITFDKRFEKYLDPGFFQHRIHWFSVFNSFMMVIFLVGLVGMILMRTLRKDYTRYHNVDEFSDDKDFGDDYGWKQVRGDVFRSPSMPTLFSSLLGSGCHIAAVSFIIVCHSLYEEMYTERGSFMSAIIFYYTILSPINGYVGASYYHKFGGKKWIRQIIIGTGLFPVSVSFVSLSINFVAIYYHASRAIPFTSMLTVIVICLFVILPLSFIGACIGRHFNKDVSYPCRINVVPRPIPDKKWYFEPLSLIIASGVLPFGSIFIEMYFIFTSFWAYKIYYVYGFMLLVIIILAIVTTCSTIVSIYCLLNAEDYRWTWTSFFAGASTTFYFGYMGLFSLAIGLMCGTIGYIGASKFIHKIYSAIKLD
ncbi:Nonaspanin (TM9SF) family-containing protein [Strongyloides ratti]|uniref:Transmembrane 9 superfamily member n=1 Tax=Strongyloides ratti TaxID=34506 RepID=A0A090KQW9_STRRB|nr:Nonaspanin (TM9SF) family-containing protein [Strongyloides ratti]CEF59928.1 Nonaspanin (TM9SF) family-containing protein [Strongyloides ratti]